MEALTQSDIFGILEFTAVIALILGILFTALFYEYFNHKKPRK